MTPGIKSETEVLCPKQTFFKHEDPAPLKVHIRENWHLKIILCITRWNLATF